jgi:hypothetical protein
LFPTRIGWTALDNENRYNRAAGAKLMGVTKHLPQTEAELFLFISNRKRLHLSHEYTVVGSPRNIEVGLVSPCRARLYR